MTIIHSFYAFPYAIPCAILMVIGIVIATISITFLSAYTKDDRYDKFMVGGMLLGVALTIFPIFIGSILETHHQIIIDENTSFIEVQQKYEIIEQKGISYRIFEQEVSNF
jgi:uncharacterized membrane protein